MSGVHFPLSAMSSPTATFELRGLVLRRVWTFQHCTGQQFHHREGERSMAAARFQFANPVRPAGGAVPVRATAWRLIGGNNRDLGCAPDGYESREASREAVLRLKARITEAVPIVTIDPTSSEWTWRLEIDGRIVARSARGYLRHRECLYNVSHFLGSVPTAALPGDASEPAALLSAEAPVAIAWVTAILAIEAAQHEPAETDGPTVPCDLSGGVA
jgi:hypothetical protein